MFIMISKKTIYVNILLTQNKYLFILFTKNVNKKRGLTSLITLQFGMDHQEDQFRLLYKHFVINKLRDEQRMNEKL